MFWRLFVARVEKQFDAPIIIWDFKNKFRTKYKQNSYGGCEGGGGEGPPKLFGIWL